MDVVVEPHFGKEVSITAHVVAFGVSDGLGRDTCILHAYPEAETETTERKGIFGIERIDFLFVTIRVGITCQPVEFTVLIECIISLVFIVQPSGLGAYGQASVQRLEAMGIVGTEGSQAVLHIVPMIVLRMISPSIPIALQPVIVGIYTQMVGLESQISGIGKLMDIAEGKVVIGKVSFIQRVSGSDLLFLSSRQATGERAHRVLLRVFPQGSFHRKEVVLVQVVGQSPHGTEVQILVLAQSFVRQLFARPMEKRPDAVSILRVSLEYACIQISTPPLVDAPVQASSCRIHVLGFTM